MRLFITSRLLTSLVRTLHREFPLHPAFSLNPEPGLHGPPYPHSLQLQGLSVWSQAPLTPATLVLHRPLWPARPTVPSYITWPVHPTQHTLTCSTHTHTHTHTQADSHTHSYTRTPEHTHMLTASHMDAHILRLTHAHAHTNVHTHTHTHPSGLFPKLSLTATPPARGMPSHCTSLWGTAQKYHYYK